MSDDPTRCWVDESNQHMDSIERFKHNEEYFRITGTQELINVLECILRQSAPGHQRFIKRHLWTALNEHIRNHDGWEPYSVEPMLIAGRRDRYGRFLGYQDARPEPPKRDDKGRFLPKEQHA